MAKKKIPDYIKYTGLGFEILACILVFAGLGYALDQYMHTEKPWFLLVFALLGCALAIFLLVRKFGNLNQP